MKIIFVKVRRLYAMKTMQNKQGCQDLKLSYRWRKKKKNNKNQKMDMNEEQYTKAEEEIEQDQ